MASSSSCSHLNPAFVSQSWNHDVFISFRGEDTRKCFVDHLYEALVQQGVNTFKDDETLARGESIGPALRKAIQESRIVVIVFSKNYADSSWCLDELAYIIECMEKRGQIVMPVFYDVDPSDVRKQKGKYEEAFSKHEGENRHKVKSWRKALVTASNLSGWVLKDFANGHQAKCIKDIFTTISSRLSLLLTNVNKDLIGIETRLQELKSMLAIGSGGVCIVGILGVGGGGKTTLASAAYMKNYHEFEACCLLENIREESRKHGLRNLQEKFVSHILKKATWIKSEIEGRSMIKSRLCHKRILVVLDDVDDLEQLDALVGSPDWFGEGSRIMITTRDEHLLTRHANNIYEVSMLSHDEALTLFSRHAFRKDKPVEDYEMLSHDVVSYAGGLPLALEILGSFLFDKDMDEWISALAKLKRIPNVKVMERLKISYDGLEHYEKELFLDIACFLRRWEIDRAMRVLEACSFYPVIGVKVLTQKSLIKVSNGKFDMHDLVEEMAHYIVRGEHPNRPEKHSRIWQEKDIVEICGMGAENFTENNHIEVLALPSYISHPNLPHVGAIKVRDFHLFEVENSLLPGYVSHPRLPDVVANMKKLRWIYWEGYPTSSFLTNFHPAKLCCLISIRGQQTHLWKGRKDLPNLKILDLHYSFLLTTTPDFNGLPCLEALILEDCKQLKEIHPSIGYHKRLAFVNMRGCKELKTFPPIICMKQLETLDLSFCFRLQKFPDIQTDMDSLVNLLFDRTGIDIIPPSVGKFCTNLVSFDLSECGNLKRIEGNFRLLKRLKYLHLSGCRIYLQFFRQNTLASPKLPQLPRNLRKLKLSGCNLGDGDMPSDMSGFINLQVLDLSGNHFTRLHSSLSQIPCLKLLNLSYCESLVEMPDLPSSIAILEANGCVSLQSVEDLSNYKCLWKVSLWDSKKLIGDGDRLLHSILQVNADQDRFMSIHLPSGPSETYAISDLRSLTTMQLPHNWYSDFSGILFWVFANEWPTCTIVLKQEMLSMESQPGYPKEFNKKPESYSFVRMGYVPFGSLRHTSWWNPTHPSITFQIDGLLLLNVGLVPRTSKPGDSRGLTVNCSEFWDEKYKNKKTFEILDDSKSSSIQIVWSH
ncbi:disease resistance protein Roq1-like [Bidens hawaiensis]|uniref:disease resistance protein Roq1-like n=1 Tax=Bidens hawaiensis TaxID=980011 RepID=UPI00404AADE6